MRAAPFGFIGFTVQNLPGSVVPSQHEFLEIDPPVLADRKDDAEVVELVRLVIVQGAVTIHPFEIDDVLAVGVAADEVAFRIHVGDDLVEPGPGRRDVRERFRGAYQAPRHRSGEAAAQG
jgi:hypothetical protein